MFVELNRNSAVPLKKQLYDQMTEKILLGELVYGDKLPSTRELALQLNMARNSIIEVYEQLIAETYLESVRGLGTFVSNVSSMISVDKKKFNATMQVAEPSWAIDFTSGYPDLSYFPKNLWTKMTKEVIQEREEVNFGYNDPCGHLGLREALVKHLALYKGIKCKKTQVIITAGTADSLALLALFFNEDCHTIAIENPVVEFVRHIFARYNYEMTPVAVDEKGIIVDEEIQGDLIFVSPSHQFPMGGTLPLNRRQKLCAIAQKGGAYILEDDYDSEFRYKGAPVNSLFQLSPSQVIHMGTFSKTLAPGIRIGYMVLPEILSEPMAQLCEQISHRADMVSQSVLEVFISSGRYSRHVNQVRKKYKKKAAKMTELLEQTFSDAITIYGDNGGMHLCVRFKERLFNSDAFAHFNNCHICVPGLNHFYHTPKEETDTLVLGYGHLSLDEIEVGIKLLEEAVNSI